MPSKSLKSKASGSPSHCKANSVPQEKLPQSYMVVDATLPLHIINDRALFTTYTSGRRVHRTALGHDIVIEGTGDAEIRVFAAGQYICFCLRNCWHVPSSPHHFLSCTAVTSKGYQVMIAGRTPRMLFPNKRRLAEPRLPKYVPLEKLKGYFVLKFEVPAQQPISSQPLISTTTVTAALDSDPISLHAITFQPFAALSHSLPLLPQAELSSHFSPSSSSSISLQASTYHPIASLTSDRHPLPIPQVSFSLAGPHPSASDDMAAAGTHEHAVVMSHAGAGVVLHGGAQALVDMDMCFPLDDVTVALHGGADEVVVPVDVNVDDIFSDAEDQAANMCVGDPIHRVTTTSSSSFTLTLTASLLNFFNRYEESNTLCASSRYFHQYFSFVNNSSFLSSTPPFYTLPPSASSFFTSVPQLHTSFSSQIFGFSIPFQFHLSYSRLHDFTFIPPARFKVSPLPFTISSPTFNSFHPSSRFNSPLSNLHFYKFVSFSSPLHFSWLSFVPTPSTVPIFQYHPTIPLVLVLQSPIDTTTVTTTITAVTTVTTTSTYAFFFPFPSPALPVSSSKVAPRSRVGDGTNLFVVFDEHRKLEGWCTWDLNGRYYFSGDLPVIFNENVLGHNHLGISRSISLPIPAESFFPSRPFRIRTAAGQGYDDVICLRDFRTAERPGEIVLVVDVVEHGGVASAVVGVDVVAGIGDGVGVQVVLHGGDSDVEFSLDGGVPVPSGEHNRLLPILGLVRAPLLHITQGHLSSSGSRSPMSTHPVGNLRKIGGHVLFHPVASNVLASSSGGYTVKLCDLATGNLEDPQLVLSERDSTTCRDSLVLVTVAPENLAWCGS